MTGIDLADRNRQLRPVFDLVDGSIPDPDHLVGNIEHLKIMGGGDHRNIALLAQAL